ncbi:hypothetical protein ABG067_000588 [Albugo candida]
MNHIAAQCLVIIAFIMINSSWQHPGNNNEDTSDKKTLRQEINDLLVKFKLLIADKKRATYRAKFRPVVDNRKGLCVDLVELHLDPDSKLCQGADASNWLLRTILQASGETSTSESTGSNNMKGKRLRKTPDIPMNDKRYAHSVHQTIKATKPNSTVS